MSRDRKLLQALCDYQDRAGTYPGANTQSVADSVCQGRVLQEVHLEAPDSALRAWYTIKIIEIPGGHLVTKLSGAAGRKPDTETWFRPTLEEAEKKLSRIVQEKTDPNSKRKRHYILKTAV